VVVRASDLRLGHIEAKLFREGFDSLVALLAFKDFLGR
jgi:hypothetical protein